MTLDNRHKLAAPYWARPGIRLFAKKVDDENEGGADDGDDADDEEEDDEEEDDLAELSVDELKAELKRTRDSLKGANGSSKARRLKIERLKNELEEARKPKPTKAADGDEPDAEAIKATAKAEARAESDARIRRIAVRSELKAAGIPADQAAKLIGLVDLEALDVDDDGEVDGLDEAIDELKAAWPQLFNVKPIKRQRQSVAGQKSDTPPKGKLTASQIQAAAATGKRAG